MIETKHIFTRHMAGKVGLFVKTPIINPDDMAVAYMPGVANVCQAIADTPELVHQYTIKMNSVAVVTDGTAVPGLGDIGPAAALPVMEGKAVLFKTLAGIDAYPICLSTKNPREIVETVANLATGFGGINLENISAPRCFEIERELQAKLDIPVFHDDQHGTAVVVLAALSNAAIHQGRDYRYMSVVVSGCGAAGVAIARILLAAGVTDVIVCDSHGIVHPHRLGVMNDVKFWLANQTNPRGIDGGLPEALIGADVFIGVSTNGVLTRDLIGKMTPKPVIFSLANPIPESTPEEVRDLAGVFATGRSDNPNQINNVLAFPGIFRGALDVRARRITENMKVAAAKAIAARVTPAEIKQGQVVPEALNPEVAYRVAHSVARQAIADGVARYPEGLPGIARNIPGLGH